MHKNDNSGGGWCRGTFVFLLFVFCLLLLFFFCFFVGAGGGCLFFWVFFLTFLVTLLGVSRLKCVFFPGNSRASV